MRIRRSRIHPKLREAVQASPHPQSLLARAVGIFQPRLSEYLHRTWFPQTPHHSAVLSRLASAVDYAGDVWASR